MNIKTLTRHFIAFGVASTVMYLAYLGITLRSVFALFFLAWKMSPRTEDVCCSKSGEMVFNFSKNATPIGVGK